MAASSTTKNKTFNLGDLSGLSPYKNAVATASSEVSSRMHHPPLVILPLLGCKPTANHNFCSPRIRIPRAMYPRHVGCIIHKCRLHIRA
ncbi:hypothetical protein QL285_059218 [Trifolium repens]|nr:hypothetical protein QL285_059218 [Trifolium repens]